MSKIIVEQVKNCKLVYEESEPNGHDCWGNYEWSTNYFINYKGKREQVFEDWWIKHDGTNVLDYASKEKWLDIPRVDSPVTTISDKDITFQEKVSNPYPSDSPSATGYKKGFKEGAKWALQQLNK